MIVLCEQGEGGAELNPAWIYSIFIVLMLQANTQVPLRTACGHVRSMTSTPLAYKYE